MTWFRRSGWPRRVAAVGLVAGALGSARASAKEVDLRPSFVPGVGVGGQVHPRISLFAQVQGRIVPSGAALGASPLGLTASAGPRFVLHPILSLGLSYGYSIGVFPLETAGKEEHRGEVGLRIGADGKVSVSNRVRLDLRTIRFNDGWRFEVRPRNEVALSVAFLPWLRMSLAAEGLFSPALGVVRMFQLRTGLALHGSVPLGKRRPEETKDKRPSFMWWVGSQVGLSPVALARRRVQAEAPRVLLPEPDPVAAGDASRTIDLVTTVGLSVGF